jgi:hypothetical protein
VPTGAGFITGRAVGVYQVPQYQVENVTVGTTWRTTNEDGTFTTHNTGYTFKYWQINYGNGSYCGRTTASILHLRMDQTYIVTPVFAETSSGSVQWSAVILSAIIVPLCILFIPSLILLFLAGKWGFIGGLAMMLIIGTITGIVPWWLTIIVGIALAILVYEDRKAPEQGAGM